MDFILSSSEEKKRVLNELKVKSKMLYVNSNSILKKVEQRFSDDLIGYGVFNYDGYLLKLYGGRKFRDWCSDSGIQPGTRWSDESIGCNAVGLGLKYKKYMETLGEDHENERLKQTACYFEPITTKLNHGKHVKEKLHGGIAILCPVERANSLFRSLVEAVANAVSLQYLWFNNLNLYMDAFEGYGYIFLDKSLGKNSIIAMGENAFHILKVKKRDYYYEELEKIIPDTPKNQQFWHIVNDRIECNDAKISVYINGKTVKICISTVNFLDERFHMDGVLIAMNSIGRINKLISNYVGMSAHLTFEDIVGESEELLDAVAYAKAASGSTSNILLLGESGTGKDVFAQAIHNNSDRWNQPYVTLNCAALSKELISSELFGYEEGAFTGARKGGNIGKFELANHGTLFLDEIGDMPLDLQATLLRVIEQQSFMKLGGNTLVHVDVRIIAATNVDLMDRVRNNLFREDLFYRLGIVRIQIPPLRKRGNDIFLLAEHFMDKICSRAGKDAIEFSDELKEFFRNYSWPGNVRELQNLLEGLINIEYGKKIELDFVKNYLGIKADEKIALPLNDAEERADGVLEQFEPHSYKKILEALNICKNNRSKAAELLGVSRSTLYRKMKEYGMIK